MINECEKISKFSGEIEINESFLELCHFDFKMIIFLNKIGNFQTIILSLIVKFQF
ncbi:hypothetical protein [Campylobacter portucalensis]|uniref:hypothetical protein n=1 Tax=Campylobacter portucalensis TaxID=2608384 RepID=UPI0012B24E0B|nr:hypothetical protein [Campylobacter portucalensis]